MDFKFANTGDRIHADFKFDKRNARKQVPCAEIFGASTLLRIGTGARCQWPNTYDQDFEVIFGAEAQVMPGEMMQMNLNPFSTNRFYKLVLVHAPNVAPLPVAILKAPLQIGVCDDVHLDASFSSSSDRRMLTHLYQCTSGYRIESLNNFLATQTSPFVTIPSDLVEPGFPYTITLQVVNVFNVSSDATNVTFSKLSSVLPIVSIDGPKVQYVSQVATKYTVTGLIQLPCRSAGALSSSWIQTFGPAANFSQKGNTITIEEFPFFASSYELRFSFKAFMISQPALASSVSVSIHVQQTILRARVVGGTQKSVPFTAPIVLDGSASYDPSSSTEMAQYEWVCTSKSTEGLCALSNPSYQEAKWILPAASLQPGSYIFNLTYSKDSRISKLSVQVTVLPDEPQVQHPIVTLGISHATIHKNVPKIEARGVAVVANHRLSSNAFAYDWQIVDVTGDNVNIVSSIALSSTTDFVIVFSPATLIEGHTYNVNLTVNYTNPNGVITQGFSLLSFVVVDSPLIGEFIVTPLVGIALQTEFTLSCQQFTTDNPPLQYSFGYLDADKQVPLSYYSQTNALAITLPAKSNLTLFAKVKQGTGSVLTLFKTVHVHLPVALQSSVIVNETVAVSSNASLAFFKEEVEKLNQTIASERETSTLLAKTNVLLALLNEDTTSSSGEEKVIETSTEGCPIYQASMCSNNCSNNGICIGGSCLCNSGFTGKDCRYSESELNEKEQIRYKLLVGVISAINTQFKEDEASVSQLAQLCEKLTAIYEEVSQSSQELVLDFFASLVTRQSIDEDIGRVLLKTLSNIAQSIERSSSSKNSNAMFHATEILMKNLAVKKYTGDTPLVVNTYQMSSVTSKTLTNKLASKRFSICSGNGNSTEVVLPEIFKSAASNNSATGEATLPEEVSVQMSIFRQNPYFWSNTSKNITSDVVRIDMMNPTGSLVKLVELTEPIKITIPVRDETVFSRNFSQIRFVCKYWNTTLLEWKTNGCKLANYSLALKQVVCICNHTTDFSVFIENIPASEAKIVINDETPPVVITFNYTTSATTAAFALFTLSLLILGTLIQCCRNLCSKDEFSSVMHTRSKKSKQHTTLVATLLTPWTMLAILMPFKSLHRTFSRLERLVLINMGISIILALHTLNFTFGATNNYAWLYASIAIGLISSVVYRSFGTIVQESSPGHLKLSKIQTDITSYIQQVKYKQGNTNGMYELDDQTTSQQSSTPRYREEVVSTPSSPRPFLIANPNESFVAPRANWTSWAKETFGRRIVFGTLACTLFTALYLLLAVGFSYVNVIVLPYWNYITVFSCSMAFTVAAWMCHLQILYTHKRIRAHSKLHVVDAIYLVVAIGSAVLSFLSASGITAVSIFRIEMLQEYPIIASVVLWLFFVFCLIVIVCQVTLLYRNKRRNKIDDEESESSLKRASCLVPQWIIILMLACCIIVTLGALFVANYWGIRLSQHKAQEWLIAVLVSVGIDQIGCSLLHTAYLLAVKPMLLMFVK